MSAPRSDRRPAARSQRPKATTVFAAAFLAGAAAAVGLNRTLDVHLAQRRPRVESEPIFVALRSLPQGAPLTVWDVALRDWPKAMLPAAALRPRDSFDGMVLKHPVREGQPILSVQLVKVSPSQVDSQLAEATAAPAATPPPSGPAPAEQTDLWAPAEVPAPAIQPSADVPHTAATEVVADPTVVVSVGDTVPEEPAVTPVESPSEPSAAVPADAVATGEVPGNDSPIDPVTIEDVVAEPVVVDATTDTDIDVAIAPAANDADSGAAPTREMVMRYLVVPERIALEADRSFVPPLEQQRDAAAGSVAQTPSTQQSSPTTRPQVQEGRNTRPAARTSSNRDRQPQRPQRSAAGLSAPVKDQEKQSFLRSMMPSLSLGMGAVEARPKTEPRAKTESRPKTAAKPESKSEQAPRSTSRGFGFFR